MPLLYRSASIAAAPAGLVDEESSIIHLVALVRHELMFHGLDWPVREEIEQEIALWLVRKRASFDVTKYPEALAAALVRQFLRPDNLRRWEVEERLTAEAAAPHSSLRCASAGDESLAAAEWLRALAPKDRRIATCLLSGSAWIEACEKENVPPGSRAFRQARIRAALYA